MLLGVATISLAQEFTKLDTLRGSITPEREWWDLTYYDLNIKVEPEEEHIAGFNDIYYKVLKGADVIQVDLQEPLKIDSAIQDGKPLEVTNIGPAHFIKLKKRQLPGAINKLRIAYSGKPRKALRAPWDGGFSWSRDGNNLPFAATSCQGLGASVWWPNKDHMYDEVDSMLISVKVPEGLMDVSNGRLRQTDEHEDGSKTFHWFVSNPISNYVVNLNVSDYVQFSEQYEGLKGTLDCDYFVLPYNLEKAQEQFKDVGRMLEAFEHWFGPYPFYEDGFKLVEVPYPGMEHQSSVTYGNGFKNGYGGRDVSGTGWGFKFDFIIIHEAGHEWFANNITYKDIADMWIHESFTAYSEGLFVDFHYGKEAGAEYVVGTRQNIRNDRPIIGAYDVNHGGSGDMYSKGANMLHTLRQWVNNDGLWRQALRGLNKTFYHQTVTTQQIEEYLAEKLGLELKVFFDQYLRSTDIPVLEYQLDKKKLKYRWHNCLEGFVMPIKVKINGKDRWLTPRKGWTTHLLQDEGPAEIVVDQNFYIESKRL